MERTESGSEIEQLESPGAWIKMGLKKKITLKHLEKGTAIPKIEEPKIEPPKPVSIVIINLLFSGENRKTGFSERPL